MLLIAEVAARLRLSERTIRRRIADGTIKAEKIGRAVRIPESALPGHEPAEVPAS